MENPEVSLQNSTYVDIYYKGFHIGVTDRNNGVLPKDMLVNAMSLIDFAVAGNCQPSWNNETNNQYLNVKPAKTEVAQVSEAESFQEAVNTISDMIGKTTPCTVHQGASMKYRDTGYGIKAGHARRLGDVFDWCNGYGYKSERAQAQA